MDFSKIKDPAFELLRKVIARGMASGIFREEIDPDQLILSILTYTFSYFSNKYTLSKLLGRKMEEEENINRRVSNVTEMFLKYMCN